MTERNVFEENSKGRLKHLPVVDPSHPINYSKHETPPNYVCGKCGASGCKLWREYQTFLNHQNLRCAPCAAETEEEDISNIDKDGLRESNHGMKTDQIGWYIPAVPTEENDTYWGYTSVPERGVQWWRGLPTLPA